MDDRRTILKKLANVHYQVSDPDLSDLPGYSVKNLLHDFIKNLSLNGGTGIHVKRSRLNAEINKLLPRTGPLVNLVDEIPVPSSLQVDISRLPEVNHLKRLIVNGTIGVGENGAVWLTQNELIDRRLPFITDHLIIVIRSLDLVPDLLEAYRRIDLTNSGYGIFIAGPSKTADIEQSLVIGAQGSSHHTVIITD